MQETSFKEFPEQHISLKEIILSLRKWVSYLFLKWYIIIPFAIVGAVAGFWYATTKKPQFTATTTFVLENGDGKGGLGQYAGVASMMGIDIDAGSGIFQGENILELYKSRNMITQALLSTYNADGKSHLLIDRFIEFNNLKSLWRNKSELDKIQFNANNKYSSARLQLMHDSLLGQIVKQVRANYLIVGRSDKKLNIFSITTKSPDQVFSKAFNDKLVTQVNNFYLETKTKKALENVEILQGKADSVRAVMAGSINRAAIISDAIPNQNPTRMAQRLAPMQNAKVNSEISKDVLASLLQNLEMSKMTLLKERPLIQIVDEPILPLDVTRTSRFGALILGATIAILITVMLLILRKIIITALKS